MELFPIEMMTAESGRVMISCSMGSTPASIAFRVLTPSVDIHERFRPDEPMGEVVRWSLSAIGYPQVEREYTLCFNAHQLDLAKPIAAYVRRFGWKDGTTLELMPRALAAGTASR
jgi:hypothetical protein